VANQDARGERGKRLKGFRRFNGFRGSGGPVRRVVEGSLVVKASGSICHEAHDKFSALVRYMQENRMCPGLGPMKS
jgi:hypothetical protein